MECTITNNIKKIDHIVLTTAHPKRCISFYKQLGFQVINTQNRYELYAGDFKINVHIVGHEFMPNAYLAKPGTLDVCIEICSVLNIFREELINKGMEVTKIGMKHGVRGEMYSFYLRDPDKNLLEFCSYT